MAPYRQALTIAGQLLALVGAVVVAVSLSRPGDWQHPLFGALLAFAVAGDWTAPRATRKPIKLSGSFLALVMAMVFLGPAPAAALGVGVIAIGWFKWRDTPADFRVNLVAFAWFPVVGAVAFDAVRSAIGADPSGWLFYALIFGVFMLANALNLLLVGPGLDRSKWQEIYRLMIVPGLPSQFAAALLTLGVAYLYVQIGIAAIALLAVVFLTFQYLLGRLLISEERRDELERRTNQLASFQVGLLSAMLRTLDLRDRMTARHSAAVARYSREIAAGAGLSEEEQELVHTAGLLHDIGKFTFPDHILKADAKLGEADWSIIRTHPYEGARIVSQVEGYGPMGEIILAHHERIDGKGYPRGLKGEEIPPLARIISVADVYDVLTARDSYREPVSSFEAIQELRRVAGTQLDARFVDVFVELLAGRDLSYRHGEDADFDAELALEKRVHDYAERPAGAPPEDVAAEDADGHRPAAEGLRARKRRVRTLSAP